MSLALSIGGHHDAPPDEANWLDELNSALRELGEAPHSEPACPLEVWSARRRAAELSLAAGSSWTVLGHFSLNDAVFIPRPLDSVLRAPTGLYIGPLSVLCDELEALEAKVGDAASEELRDSLAVFRAAAAEARRAQVSLWLR